MGLLKRIIQAISRIRLMPKEKKFFEMLKQQAENLKKGAEALQDLVDHFVDVKEKYQKIKQIEHKGDIITHDIINALRGTFITPFDREDIHKLASYMDDVLDGIEGVASRLTYFEIKEPTPELKQLVDIIDEAVHQICSAVAHLEKLGYVHAFCEEISRLESEADDICHKATADLFKETKRLFQETNDMDLVLSLIKLKEIYSRLETASDRCEDVANVIEGISVKSY